MSGPREKPPSPTTRARFATSLERAETADTRQPHHNGLASAMTSRTSTMDSLSQRPQIRTVRQAYDALTSLPSLKYWRLFLGVLLQMAWTAGVVLVNQLTRVKPTTSAEQIVILGTIVALALGFKVQGGSADWADARLHWAAISAASRSLGCLFWLHTRLPIHPPPTTEIVRRPTPVPNAPAPLLPSLSASGGPVGVLSNEEERLNAFDDRRRNLLKFLDLLAVGMKCEFGGALDPEHRDRYDRLWETLKPGHHMLRRLEDRGRIERPTKWTKLRIALGWDVFIRRKDVDFKASRSILFTLSQCVRDMVNDGQVNDVVHNRMLSQLAALESGLANMARLANGPLPRAYSLLLHVSVWAFLMLLPFQILSELHWWTFPVMFVSSIIYLSFLEIGVQIEDPFVQFEDLHVKEMTRALMHDLDHICRNGKEGAPPLVSAPIRVEGALDIVLRNNAFEHLKQPKGIRAHLPPTILKRPFTR